MLPPLPVSPPQAAEIAAALACAHVHPQVILLADLERPALAPRLTVIDLRGAHPRVVMRTQIAQGHGWSNRAGSLDSSAGLYRVGAPYVGAHGESWHLHGLTPGWNTRARARAIVLHDAWYVGPRFVAESWGCPAVSVAALHTLRADHLLPPFARAWLWIRGPGIHRAPALACAAGRRAAAAQRHATDL